MSNPNLVRKIATDTVSGESSGADVLPIANRANNILMNGNFDFWQRTTSINLGNSPSYVIAADRWKGAQGQGAGTYFMSRVSLTGESATYALRAGRNNGATEIGVHVVQQVLESQISRMYRGKYLTLSLRLRKSSGFTGTQTLAEIRTGTGTDQPDSRNFTGGAVAAQLVIPSSSLTTSFQTFTVTTTIPIAASVNQIGIHIESSGFTGTAGANDYVEMSQVMLNEGQVAAPFSLAGRTLAEELHLCQRYYEKNGNITDLPGTNNEALPNLTGIHTNLGVYTHVDYKAQKRAIPTVFLWDNAGNINRIIRNGANNSTVGAGGSGTTPVSSTYGFYSDFFPSGATSGDYIAFNWTSDAEL